MNRSMGMILVGGGILILPLACTEDNPTGLLADGSVFAELGGGSEDGGSSTGDGTGALCTANTFVSCKTPSQLLLCNGSGSATVIVDCTPYLCESAAQRCSQCDPADPAVCEGPDLVFCSPEGPLIKTTCASGCQNNDCVDCTKKTYYRDWDKDSYGDANVSIEACGQPGGYVLNSEDCDDIDPAAHPNQNAFFNEPTKGTNNYDYNCNGNEEPQDPSLINCASSGMSCAGDGWIGSVPACGTTGTWGKCNKQGSGNPGCSQTTSQKIQSCH